MGMATLRNLGDSAATEAVVTGVQQVLKQMLGASCGDVKEMKARLTVMLPHLCPQWQKRTSQQLLSNAISVTV